MERFGLVGLPNAGKSSLYNALTGGGALAAPYAFATKDPNIGIAKVPDERLDRLSAMSASKKTIHAAVEVVDIGGLVEGASKGEGLGNKFLANIREVDAVVFVLRAFEDPDVTGPSDPLEHLRVVELELALADLETVEKRVADVERRSKLDKTLGDDLEALQVAYASLSEGRPLYRAGLDQLPFADLPVLPTADGDSVSVVQFDLDVEQPGVVAFQFDSPEGLSVWVDSNALGAAQSPMPVDLPVGVHRITLAIDRSIRDAASVYVGLAEEATTARARFVVEN